MSTQDKLAEAAQACNGQACPHCDAEHGCRPQPAQDAKDAARYRWLRDAPQELVEVYFATDKNPTGWGDWNSWKDKDAGIDTHMAKESGR